MYFEADWDLGPPSRGSGGKPSAPAAELGDTPSVKPSKPNAKKRKQLRARAGVVDGDPSADGDGRPAARVDKRARQAPAAAPPPTPTPPPPHPPAAAAAPPAPPAAKLQQKLVGKLQGARFRQLNEELYTTDSAHAVQILAAQPELFDAYHAGFREQVRRWPVNPLDSLIEWARAELPADAVIGDFGCGEAKLAASVPQRVHSFDLVAVNPSVVACDIARVPLRAGALDVAIFCLALMGTNWTDFIREAHRTLRVGGTLKIVEVRSRVDDVADFVRTLRSLGFEKKRLDAKSNSHFLTLEATKAERRPEAEPHTPKPLAPCIYKRR